MRRLAKLVFYKSMSRFPSKVEHYDVGAMLCFRSAVFWSKLNFFGSHNSHESCAGVTEGLAAKAAVTFSLGDFEIIYYLCPFLCKLKLNIFGNKNPCYKRKSIPLTE